MQATSVKPAPCKPRSSRGYVVDEHGQEQPITEDMIQQACRELEQALARATQPRPIFKRR
ncbi:PA1571 family protein [Pseudomonas sp. 5P_3.1_Bac2]|uniref:PA1571 family protein n=1 Tax=Pseudomonas sp. 5P_3.1_Bac2 TaxID=2971617 RepID=UPI0021C56A47|nr:PA1571 family protein [Pseudomonas sp. 5P_3.1_Bac2]MCU1716894.1 hypothetical protein [Pseudomonas sp. 5P_3.1_Bac2]